MTNLHRIARDMAILAFAFSGPKVATKLENREYEEARDMLDSLRDMVDQLEEHDERLEQRRDTGG